MFRLQQCGQVSGDCTAPYNVILDKVYTVEEFITTVLEHLSNEWGYIGIMDANARNIFGNPNCEYSHGKLSTAMPESFMNRKIHRAHASGGWSRMDYLLELENCDIEVLREPTQQLLRPTKEVGGTFGMCTKRVNETVNTFAGACNFINHTAQPGVFYKWTKVEKSSDLGTTVTTMGIFVVMNEFPVKVIYTLGSDRNPNPTVSGLIKADRDTYINAMVGATITNAALKNV